MGVSRVTPDSSSPAAGSQPLSTAAGAKPAGAKTAGGTAFDGIVAGGTVAGATASDGIAAGGTAPGGGDNIAPEGTVARHSVARHSVAGHGIAGHAASGDSRPGVPAPGLQAAARADQPLAARSGAGDAVAAGGRESEAAIPAGLCPQAWREAGALLVPPPPAAAAAPHRPLPLQELIERIALCHRAIGSPEGLEPPESWSDEAGDSPLAGLALALLERSWSEAEREQLRRAADALRRRLAGETVSYVINRNLNSSNICLLHCGFCAFRRDEGQPGAYRLAIAQLVERARQGRRRGATELCLQAALDPRAKLGGSHLAWAESLLLQLREAEPSLHLHAFSPQELLFLAQADAIPLAEVLARLQAAGLGSVPGTAAEVLSEPVRRLICPEKLSARAWVAVMVEVQRQGLAATSTLMAGHLEGPADRVAHLLTLVALQRRAWQHRCRGFSEFVLLPFIGASAPAPLRQRVGRDQPDTAAMLLLTAQARLLLGPWFVHHQPSWVKLTLPHAVEALRWGCDDIGGTLMEEHITTMAGASGGTCQSPQALRRAVAAIGRPVRQRTTLYGEAPGRRCAGGGETGVAAGGDPAGGDPAGGGEAGGAGAIGAGQP